MQPRPGRMSFEYYPISVLFCQSFLPSINKGKHACQRVLGVLFVLLALAGASPPRLKSQKSLENPSPAGTKQFYRAEMCPGKEGPAGNTCRISKGRDAAWAHFCPAKPYLPLSIDGTRCAAKERAASAALSHSISSFHRVNRFLSPCTPKTVSSSCRSGFCSGSSFGAFAGSCVGFSSGFCAAPPWTGQSPSDSTCSR